MQQVVNKAGIDGKIDVETKVQNKGYGYDQIAQKLNKHKSVIHRELKRNSDQRHSHSENQRFGKQAKGKRATSHRK